MIRWAFEAQGLYGKSANGPGFPPPVDIYIADNRPPANNKLSKSDRNNYNKGDYIPVSLDWDLKQVGADKAPAWQATPQAIDVNGDKIYVTVGNRGSKPATDVVVCVWYHDWPDGAPYPKWNDGHWNPWGGQSPKQTVAADGPTTFGPFTQTQTLPSGRRYLVMAEATCADDRSNSDKATRLPCSDRPTPLIDLVANDNNLGLLVVKS